MALGDWPLISADDATSYQRDCPPHRAVRSRAHTASASRATVCFAKGGPQTVGLDTKQTVVAARLTAGGRKLACWLARAAGMGGARG